MIGFLLLPLAITVLALGRLLPIMIAGVLLLAVTVFAVQRVTRKRSVTLPANDRTDPGTTPQPTYSSPEFPHPVFSESPNSTDTVSAARNSTTEFTGAGAVRTNS